ncbi:dTMP kinase [Micromonospora radicis]|uniref:dTMP kinase n=1 Tax=Micromonospora radicis TaxID=1894971 RepID=UPI001F1F0ABC|nr:thymidylate kinase [Micromonospora radicis]
MSRRPRLRTIALVGIDGSGKTTQAQRLAATLTEAGRPARYHRNAGGRRWLGRAAQRLGRPDAQRLLGRDAMLVTESVLRWLAIALALLGCLLSGRVAVMDRYAVCQYASLRAHGGQRWERLVRAGYRLFPRPQVTFLLTVDPAEAYRRIEQRGTDHESLEYLAAADLAYHAVPEYPTFVPVRADRPPEEVAREIRGHLAGWLAAEGDPADRDSGCGEVRAVPGATALIPARALP